MLVKVGVMMLYTHRSIKDSLSRFTTFDKDREAGRFCFLTNNHGCPEPRLSGDLLEDGKAGIFKARDGREGRL